MRCAWGGEQAPTDHACRSQFITPLLCKQHLAWQVRCHAYRLALPTMLQRATAVQRNLRGMPRAYHAAAHALYAHNAA